MLKGKLSAERDYPTKNRPYSQLVLTAGILIIAAFLRLWRISRVPPGLYRDESYNLLQAQEIEQGRSWPIFITGNYGEEPMDVYLTALILKIMGPMAWAGRLAMAWAGIIGVAATIRCGNEMFPGRKIGMLAGAVLVALFWHVDFSRYGVEPILASVVAACSMAAFWNAVRTGSRWAYMVTGICLGLGLYTYPAFRAFLLIQLGAFLVVWITRRVTESDQRSVLMGGVLAGSIALLIFAPLGLFFVQHPGWFDFRFQEIAIPLNTGVNTIKTLLSNAWVTTGGLFVKGDANWRHNFAGRPALDIFQAVFFVLGLGVMVWHWPKPQSWVLWIWLLGGLLPSILTIEAPHFGRMVIVTPALALAVALGMELTWKSFPWRIGPWLVGIAFCLSVALTTRDYFVLWANRSEVFDAFEGRQFWAGRALQSAPAGACLFATSFRRPNYLYPEFSTTVDYLIGSQAKQNLRTFHGQTCLVVPYQTESTTVYAIPAADESTLSALRTAFPTGTYSLVNVIGDKPDTYVCKIPPGQRAQVAVTEAKVVSFGELVQMRGYTLNAKSLRPGEPLQLTFVWKATSISQVPYEAFVHLTGPPKNDGSTIYAQQDMQPCADSYPTWWWHPNELIVDTYSIQVPMDVPSGIYSLQTGWYEDSSEGGTGARLIAMDATGQILGDTVRLAQIQVDRP